MLKPQGHFDEGPEPSMRRSHDDPRPCTRARETFDCDDPVCLSEAFRGVLDELRRYARIPSVAILLQGESGTGKTMLAEYVHKHSPRAAKPFVVVDLAAIPNALISSELLGHVRGAFTGASGNRTGRFAEASGGTLFFDEVGKASLDAQKYLLRGVDEQRITPVGSNRELKVDVRFVSATINALPDLVKRGAFLADLVPRLARHTVVIPPLRQHRRDIPLLVERFIARLADEIEYKALPSVAPDLMAALVRAPWPDNVRELATAVQGLMIEGYPSPVLELKHLPREFKHLCARVNGRCPTLEELQSATSETKTKAEAAALLGKSRATLYRWKKKLEQDQVQDRTEPRAG